MAKKQKDETASEPTGLARSVVYNRMNQRRKEVLDSLLTDPVRVIEKQISHLDCEVLRDLMIMFECPIDQLAKKVAAFKMGKTRI